MFASIQNKLLGFLRDSAASGWLQKIVTAMLGTGASVQPSARAMLIAFAGGYLVGHFGLVPLAVMVLLLLLAVGAIPQ